jgi:hypothetical protein
MLSVLSRPGGVGIGPRVETGMVVVMAAGAFVDGGVPVSAIEYVGVGAATLGEALGVADAGLGRLVEVGTAAAVGGAEVTTTGV